MNEQERMLEDQIQELENDQAPVENKRLMLAGIIYWQVLVALFGFVLSLGIQFTLGIPLLADLLCGSQETRIDYARCSEIALQSTFLVSMAFTSSLCAALGVFLVGQFRKVQGSFLFAWLASYLFFAFAATLHKAYFLDQAIGIGGNTAYQLALAAIMGGLIAAVAYHVPKWITGRPQDRKQQLIEEG